MLVWKLTDNMSSAIIIFGIAFLMLFVASPEYKKFIVSHSLSVNFGINMFFEIVYLLLFLTDHL